MQAQRLSIISNEFAGCFTTAAGLLAGGDDFIHSLRHQQGPSRTLRINTKCNTLCMGKAIERVLVCPVMSNSDTM